MTLILVEINSRLIASVKLRTAAFVAQYIEPLGYGSRPAIDPIFIMSPWPPSRFLNMGKIACVMLISPVTFVAIMTFMSSSIISGA